VAIGASLLLYTALRAASISFTFDEVFSMEVLKIDGFQLHHASYDRMAANNHWLNNFFLYLFSHIGNSPLLIRSPQLVSHVLFLVFSAKIILLFRKDLFAVGAFILINVHPYLLDFFSLARGYGLSLGCMIAALYFLVSMSRPGNLYKRILWFLMFGALAVAASFILLNFFVAATALAGLFVLLSEISVKQKTVTIAMLTAGTGAVLLLVVPHLLKMREAEALFFGSTELWQGTVSSLADRIMYGAPYTGEDHFASARPSLIVMLTLIVIVVIVQAFRKGIRSVLYSVGGCATLLLSCIILLFVVQSALFGTLYPTQRTALFLLVLLLFAFTGAIDVIVPKRIWSNAFMMVLCIPVLFHFAYCMNNTYVLDWKEAGNAEYIFRIIEEDRNTRFAGQPVLLSSDPVSGYAVQYVGAQRKAGWLEVYMHWNENPLPPGNYYLVEKRMEKFRDMHGMLLLYNDEMTGNSLYVDSAWTEHAP
jgi:hypothetical protein